MQYEEKTNEPILSKTMNRQTEERIDGKKRFHVTPSRRSELCIGNFLIHSDQP